MSEQQVEQQDDVRVQIERAMLELDEMNQSEAEQRDRSLREKIAQATLSEQEISYLVGLINAAEIEVTRRKEAIGDYLYQAQNRAASLRRWLEPVLERWASEQIHGSKSKSIKLPGGMLGFRSSARGVMWEDESKIIAYLESKCEARHLEYKPRILKDELKKIILESGKVPPGASIKEPTEKFYVK